MSRLRISTLWLRIAWPFLLFVAAGSVALALWLQNVMQRRSVAVFETLAQTNAQFFRDRRISMSEQMAGDVSRLLNVRMIIRRRAELLPEPTAQLRGAREILVTLRPEQGVVPIGGGFEAIAARVDFDHTLLLVRAAESSSAFLAQPENIGVLLSFWVLSIGLAWAITRGVVQPLRLLAARLPHIEHDSEPALPGTDREDEIGQLARAYLSTRGQLAEERVRREHAERLAILGRMATGLAHEINNPLSAIRMHGQLIDSAPAGEIEPAARASMPVLLGEVAKIESLVNQWMFLARPAPPETKRADLGELVGRTAQAHSALAVHAGVEILQSIPPGLSAKVDSRRISQAISNIVINAIQAMPDGGILHITGESDATDARLVFRDAGKGFSSEALARHAELFFSEKEGGMGIGLSVSSEIARAHGGSLAVANGPNGSAVVTLTLPLA